jgi:probable HAF family extracellular repeat protein
VEQIRHFGSFSISFCLSRLKTLFLLLGWLALIPPCYSQKVARRYEIHDRGAQLVRTLVNTPGLNALGDVAIWQTTGSAGTRATLIHGNETTELSGTQEFPIVYPADLNEAETVVGLLQAPKDMRFTRAFLWDKGNLIDLPTLGGKYAAATAINHAGVVVGNAQTNAGALHAVLWKSNQPQDLGTLDHGDYSEARDINSSGHVVGESNTTPNGKPHGFIWKDHSMRELAGIPGGTLCSAQAINDKDEIVGFCDRPDGVSHAVLWRRNKPLDLGVLGDDDDSPSTALDINIRGQIVGTSEIAEGKLRAFLWENGHMLNLNDLVPKDSGWLLLVASRINDSGQIIGRGYFQGAIHAFLLVQHESYRTSADRTQSKD